MLRLDVLNTLKPAVLSTTVSSSSYASRGPLLSIFKTRPVVTCVLEGPPLIGDGEASLVSLDVLDSVLRLL